tara:strand:- start:385 stop:900 length:516 start_codon:yes stop_codon:yes gene_type:complete
MFASSSVSWSQGSIEMLCHMLNPRRVDAHPPPLAQLALPPRPKLSFGRWLVMHVFYIDTMIYPVYSIGALFHVITSTMYLVTAQAPIAPDEIWKLIAYWLPLMLIKAAVTTQTARALQQLPSRKLSTQAHPLSLCCLCSFPARSQRFHTCSSRSNETPSKRGWGESCLLQP